MAGAEYTPEQRAQYQKELREKMNRYVEELAESWERNPADLAEYLRMQSRFPTYSPRNTMLIHAQNPGSQFVASYGFYEKMGYHIRKGQQGMRILMPQKTTYYRLRPDREWKRLTDASDETRRLIAAGAIESREEVKFRPGVVFELAQTTCPREEYPKLAGLGYNSEQHARIYDTVKAYAATLGMPVQEQDIGSSGLRGRYYPADGHIEINSLLGDTQRLSTLLHEMAHGLLEHTGQTKSTAQKEFEADALSILFTAAFDLDITEARRSHLAEAYRSYRPEWAEGESIADKMRPVTDTYQRHILPLKERVEQTLAPSRAEQKPEQPINQPRRISPASENYRLLQQICPAFMDKTYAYCQLESPGMEPLSLEWIDDNEIALSHTFVQNGDLMRDPEITMRVDTKGKIVQPLTYRMDSLGLYQEVGGGLNADLPLRRSMNTTLLTLLQNAETAAYTLTRANRMDTDEELVLEKPLADKPALQNTGTVKKTSRPKGRAFYDKAKLQQIPIHEVCAMLDIPVKRAGGRLVCAVRDERTPSCVLYPNNTFCDFGDANHGGDTINFVQYATGKDWYDAAEMLAREFGIQPEAARDSSQGLTDRQYAMIGIQADLATKNFDIDVSRYGEQRTAQFVAKYQMPVTALAEQYPEVYHNMLRNRAAPYLYEKRTAYYLELHSADTLCAAVGADLLQNPEYLAELKESCRKLTEAEQVMQRAITDKKLLTYTSKKYDVEKDIQGIRSGTLSFEVGTTAYAEIKQKTKQDNLLFRKIPAGEYFQDDQFRTLPHAAFYKAGEVNVAYDRARHHELFPHVALDPPKQRKAAKRSQGKADPAPDQTQDEPVRGKKR